METKLTPKLLANIDKGYQKTHELSAQQTHALNAYFIVETRARYSKLALTSFLVTGCVLASRLGFNTQAVRLAKLGLYAATPLVIYALSSRIDKLASEAQFQILSGLVPAQELATMRRAWQIKTSEFEEDRKALQKYKYDPQSYH